MVTSLITHAGHCVDRLFGREIAPAASDDDAQLALVVDALGRGGRKLDTGVWVR
jgi:hypothetical protein